MVDLSLCSLILDIERNFYVRFVRRQANLVVHTFARALFVSSTVFNVAPNCISNFMNIFWVCFLQKKKNQGGLTMAKMLANQLEGIIPNALGRISNPKPFAGQSN